MGRIRVLHIIPGIAIGEQSGGAEYFCVRLARLLDKAVFDSRIYAMWRYGSPAESEWQERLEGEGIPVCGLNSPGVSLGSDLMAAFTGLWSVTSAFKPHVTNSHSERGDLFNMLLRLFHPAHPRAVRTVHLDQQWMTRPWLGVLLNQAVFPWAFQREIAVAGTIRQVLEARLLTRLSKKKPILCYNGIDQALFQRGQIESPAGPASELPGTPPRLGIIGRLAEQKGHADLLQALGRVRLSHPVHLLVIGSGPSEEALREQAVRVGLAEYVHFLGSRQDVLAILPRLDLLVSASLWEGFPTVILEAMALGVPVVATDVSGSRELVRTGVTGVLTAAGQPAQLAEAIVQVLDDPAWATQMAIKARQAASPFTIQNAAATYAALYRQLVGPSVERF